MRYDYDMLGNRIHQASMEAGERWMLNDVAGKPIRAWDSRGHAFRTDDLRRAAPPDWPVRHARTASGAPGRAHRLRREPARPEATNHRAARSYQVFDRAGIVDQRRLRLQGQPAAQSQARAAARDYKQARGLVGRTRAAGTTAPSPAAPPTTRSTARGTRPRRTAASSAPPTTRPTCSSGWRSTCAARDGCRRTPSSPTSTTTPRASATLIDYGNGVRTDYDYDPLTFRLIHLQDDATDLPGCAAPERGACRTCATPTTRPATSPTSRTTRSRRSIFSNQRVEPSADYTYDAIYRLIEATGREHLGQTAGGQLRPTTPQVRPMRRAWALAHPDDGKRMGRYTERYEYDAVGNFAE